MRLATIAAALLASFSFSANAVPITWGFEGYTAGPGLPGGPCNPMGCDDILFDTYFFGSITFDSDAPDLAPGPEFGRYLSSGTGFGISLYVGGYSYQTDYVEVSVQPEPFTSIPQYSFFSEGDDVWFTTIGLFNCYEADSGVVTTDDQRDAPPPSGGGCPDPSFIRTVGGADIALNVTRYFAVPEPTTLWLVGSAFAALGLAGRRPVLRGVRQ